MKKSILSVCLICFALVESHAVPTPPEQSKPPVDEKFKLPSTRPKKDPLGDLETEMIGATRKLKVLETGEPTQLQQEDIVRRLDEMIKSLDEACKACQAAGGSSSTSNPSKPLAKSVIMGGPGGQGDMLAPKQGTRKWAQLPDAERARIMQSMTEGFPPGYQTILERYFRNMAEENTGSAEVTP